MCHNNIIIVLIIIIYCIHVLVMNYEVNLLNLAVIHSRRHEDYSHVIKSTIICQADNISSFSHSDTLISVLEVEL